MALVECSNCGKRMSSVAKSCPACNASTSGDTEAQRNIKKIKLASQLQLHSFLAMTLFIAGVVIWFWGGEPAEGTRQYAGSVCFVFGFIGYLITRVRIIINKRKGI